MSRPFGLKVMLASSEAAPFAKAGGLGDVAGSLPQALAGLGSRACLVVPGYAEAMDRLPGLQLYLKGLMVNLGPLRLSADIYRGRLADGVPLYLVAHSDFFGRRGIYGDGQGEFPDNPERYMFFSRAVLALARVLPAPPDVILANDWQTGLIMPFLSRGELPGTGGVFAIHNLGYLGSLSPDLSGLTGLPAEYLGWQGMEFHGNLSLLKAGIVYSHAVTTVSPTYAGEITSPAFEFNHGLDGLMRWAQPKLTGILNGIDTEVWSPAKDVRLAANYGPQNLAGKSQCKKQLLAKMGLPADLMDRPLIGMVTRLVYQKGSHLVAEAAPHMFENGAGLVVLGSGEPVYENQFKALAARFPQRLGLKLGYDEDLAHLIMAGCDMLLVPSRYEPCGLTQMYALAYGCLPVVRSTGGLADTVNDPYHGEDRSNGFKFWGFNGGELMQAVYRALDAFENRAEWTAMMRRGMAHDFSWRASAQQYLAVCQRAADIARA